MHVDTVGVMKSLPQKQLTDTLNAQNPYEDGKIFPNCDLLPPNTASLRGFRTLLLHRKRLSEQIERSGQDVDKISLHSSQMYEALQKRFKSIFLWPAFLSIFMPREAEDRQETAEKTPSKLPQLNLNKRMSLRGRSIPQNLYKTPIDLEDSNRIAKTISSQLSIPGTSFLQQKNCNAQSSERKNDMEASIRDFSTPTFHKTTSRVGHKEKGSGEKMTQSKEKIPRPVYVESSAHRKESSDNRIWARRRKLSDKKLSLLVNNYIAERKKNTAAALAAKSNLPLNIVKICSSSEEQQPSQEETSEKINKTATAEISSSSNVFMPLRLLEPPGEKRAMLENTVVALDDCGEAPLKKLKKN